MSCLNANPRAVTTTEANLASSLISKLPVSQLPHQDANIKYIIICLNALMLAAERLINNYTCVPDTGTAVDFPASPLNVSIFNACHLKRLLEGPFRVRFSASRHLNPLLSDITAGYCF